MNILITSAGRRAYLVRYFQEVLNGKGKVFASNSDFSIALQEADSYFISPLIYDKNYIETIVSFCKREEIDAIISVFDADLLVLSKAKEYIESQGIKLLVPDSNIVEICNDKWKTYQFLKSTEISAPLTFKSFNGVLKAIKSKNISFPIIIKPRWGSASKGIYQANSFEELNVLYHKATQDIEQSFLWFESQFTPNETIIFQEKMSGQEYGLDIINDLKGNFIGVFPKSKIRMRAGETDLGQTVPPDKFYHLAKTLSSKLKHKVILSVDCFETNESIQVIEFNCRISGHYPFSHLAGVNLPKQIIEWLQGKETNMKNFCFKEGLYITKDLRPVILNQCQPNDIHIF